MATSTKVHVPQESGEITVSRGGVKLKSFTVTDHTISPATNRDLDLALTITGAYALEDEAPANAPAKRSRRSRSSRTPTGAEAGDVQTSDDGAGDAQDD